MRKWFPFLVSAPQHYLAWQTNFPLFDPTNLLLVFPIYFFTFLCTVFLVAPFYSFCLVFLMLSLLYLFAITSLQQLCLPWACDQSLTNGVQVMHKPNKGGSQLDRSELLYLENLGLVQQETAQPNITKRPTTFKLATFLGSQETNKDRTQKPLQTMPPKSRTTRNMSVVSSQVESRPTTPRQQQPNQTEGANKMGVEPQPQPRIPTDNANILIEVLQLLQHSQQ